VKITEAGILKVLYSLFKFSPSPDIRILRFLEVEAEHVGQKDTFKPSISLVIWV